MAHTNLFRLTGTINCRISKLVIDLGSYAKEISQDTHILGLDFTAHLSPYMLAWINNGTYIKVSKQVFLSFSIGNYKDSTTCDVISMDACHLLLGLPLQFERDVVHQGKKNMYNFFFGDQTITLLSSKEKHELSSRTDNSPVKSASEKRIVNLTKSSFWEAINR